VRGKAFPFDQLEMRLARGVGWTPTNVQITCFDVIAETPYGALGDLLLIPDPDAAATVDFGDGGPPERFMLGDIVTLEGEPWACCTRGILKAALDRLHRVAGLQLRAAFEHEFQLKGPPGPANEAYGHQSFEARRSLGETLAAALSQAGLKPDTFMKEYGRDQYEITIGPRIGVHAADAAVILRELTRATARRLGDAATFTPIRDPASVGNGVHVHMSLVDDDDTPVTHDPDGPGGLSPVAGSFAAGVLKYVDSFVALTAPSLISYQRLTPHRWSAPFNNLGFRDREACLRIAPVTTKDPSSIGRQFNLEYRAADAAASPYLALAAVAHAGAQGIEENLPAPTPTQEDLSLLEPDALAGRGFVRLPDTFKDALDRMNANETVRGWFPEEFVKAYMLHKQGEIKVLDSKTLAEQCAAYEETY